MHLAFASSADGAILFTKVLPAPFNNPLANVPRLQILLQGQAPTYTLSPILVPGLQARRAALGPARGALMAILADPAATAAAIKAVALEVQELEYQIRCFEFYSCYPILRLAEKDFEQIYELQRNFRQGLWLHKGKQGGRANGPLEKVLMIDKNKRSNLTRKQYKIDYPGSPGYVPQLWNFDVGAVYLVHQGQYPTAVDQHISHYCHRWPCFQHLCWEDAFLNTGPRRACAVNNVCTCQLQPACLVGQAFPHTTEDQAAQAKGGLVLVDDG